MKKIYIILAAVAVGLFSFAGCTTSDNDTNSVTSEQSQRSEQSSDESSEQSKNSEQSSEQSSYESFEHSSEQTSDNSSEQSSDKSTSSNDEQNSTSSENENISNSSEEEQISEQKSEVSELNEEELQRLAELKERIIDEYGDSNPRVYVVDNIFYQYPNLTDEQYDQLIELRANTSLSDIYGYQEKIIVGEIDESDPKLTLADAKAIIAENDDFETILDEFKKIQKSPDWIGGSGMALSQYRPNDNDKEIILVNHTYSSIDYFKYDDDGNVVISEILYRAT